MAIHPGDLIQVAMLISGFLENPDYAALPPMQDTEPLGDIPTQCMKREDGVTGFPG
jgi:hypothetical protein